MQIINLLLTSLMSSVLLAIVGTMFRRPIGAWLEGLIQHKFAKDLEEHKSSLKLAGETSLEQLKAKLHAQTAIEQIRHSTQYDKAAQAIVELHRRLDEAYLAVREHTAPFATPESGTSEERREKFDRCIRELAMHLRQNRIYLPLPIAKQVQALAQDLSNTADEFRDAIEDNHQAKSLTEWAGVCDKIQRQIVPALERIEEHFRGMLGINSVFSDLKTERYAANHATASRTP